MSSPHPFPTRFLLRWIGLNTLGLALGFFGGFILGHGLLGNWTVGVTIGLAVALAQGFLLRRTIGNWNRWLAASFVGHGLAHAGAFSLTYLTALPWDLSWPQGIAVWGTAMAIGGTIAAILQVKCFTTPRHHPRIWIASNSVAWAACVLGLAIPPDMSRSWPDFMIPVLILRNGFLAPAAAGAILGVLTSLYWVIRPGELAASINSGNPGSKPSDSQAVRQDVWHDDARSESHRANRINAAGN